MDIQYVGEHLLPGKFGQAFVILSFGAALLASISYFFATVNDREDNSWRNIGRWSFRVHSLSVIGIGAILFYIIYNFLFEYHYAWTHSSKALPTHYIISAFWEGQEGSFLLWAFWQVVIGNILIWKAKKWENGVMTFVALSQVFITSMLIGVEILGYRIGSSPFILLRDAIEGPIFSRADYLTFITDGNGLNPLLQNYWMVIHPPTLFAGFALMVVPFAYALAGVWTKRYSEWVKYALPWGLAAVMVLGTGIIMGAFWAYEALNFGGFWAWDPVENASLFPWVIMIAGVHVLVVFKNTGHSYATALILTIMSYILVLYATFLTRSGVLGNTSVHSFTDLGMSGQLVIYLLFFVVLATVMIVKHWKNLPISSKEEQTYSREFWMFIGSLVFIISCFQLLVVTSIPVWNAIFGTNIAPPTDPVDTYNKMQLPIALVIMLMAGFSQYLKYKRTDSKKFFVKLLKAIVYTVVLTAGIVYVTKVYENLAYILLVLTCTFAVVINGEVLIDALKGKIKLAGSAVAHMGFGIMLIGALVAASQNRVISLNTYGFDYADKLDAKNSKENVLLIQNQPLRVGDFQVTYLDDSTSGPNTYYSVNYKRLDEKTGEVIEEFTLKPNGQVNPKMGLIASPDTKHYLLHDIYTHVSMVLPPEQEHDHSHEGHSEDSHYDIQQSFTLSIGDTINFEGKNILLTELDKEVDLKNITLDKGDVAVALNLKVLGQGKEYVARPIFLIKSGNAFSLDDKIEDLGLKFKFANIIPDKNQFEVLAMQKPVKNEDEWIVMKAIVFPYINLLWGGAIIMVIGFLLSVIRRTKELKHS